MKFYKAYGLTIASDLEIPELQTTRQCDTDVRICFNKIDFNFSKMIKNRIWHCEPNNYYLNVKRIGSFHVQKGTIISIDSQPQTPKEDIRFVLLGSVMAALLQQRKYLTLHAGAVQTPQGAILFTGPSGYGKSTLTQAFANKGFSVISDDVVALNTSQQKISVLPSFPKLRLWEDSLRQVGKNTNSYQRSRVGVDKYIVPVQNFCAEANPLQKIYILDVHSDISVKIEPLTTSQKIKYLLKNTYRIKYLTGLGLLPHHNQQMIALASQIPMARILRPVHIFKLQALTTLISEDLQL